MSALRFAEARSEWLDAFNADPAEELDSLLRGYTLVPPYQRANPSEVAVRLFSALGKDDPLMGLLDQSLVEWIVARLVEPEDARLEVGINAYIQHVQEALTVAHRLPLPLTVALLHDRFSDLTSWTERLNLGSARDLRADYWQTLALVQTRRSFLSLWNRCCDEAGGGLPDSYLFIGLLGLQHLPRRDGDADFSHELLTGLARWASHLDDNDTDRHRFLREWRALALRYPRACATLRNVVAPMLEVYAAQPFAKWWAEEVGIEENVKGEPPHELAKKEVEALLAKLPNLSDVAMYLEVEAMAEARKRYVDTFKDAYDLVRDFDRLSNDILERASNFSLHLSHSAVERDKSDAFSRAFMSAALHQLGLADGAELVPLEAIRRFPDDAVYQSDLAKLLAEQGRVAETEALYRETAKRLLDDVVSRTALARLLAEK
jgi:hypothetical protein